MKTKNLLIGIFSLLTFSTYAQTEEKQAIEFQSAVTELKVETENLTELVDFDWNMLKEMFKYNDANQEITLVFAYANKSEIDKSKVRVDNFKFKVTGKTADLDKLTSRLQKSFSKLAEIEGNDGN